MKLPRALCLLSLVLAACAPETDRDRSRDDDDVVDEEPPGEGVAFDDQNPGADLGPGKADLPKTYEIPEYVPDLPRPEIIVSLEGLTVHLFDRETGFSKIYPTGVGQKGSNGKSYTPTGFFKTHHDVGSSWYFIPRRYQPDYFGGFPFLRLNILNSNGHHTYGLHGPITYTCTTSSCGLLDREWFLVRDFVSHGCMRMEKDDIVELFFTVREHPSVPVSIQREVERDAAGRPLDVDDEASVWWPGDAIAYGECGERPDPYTVAGRWTSRACP